MKKAITILTIFCIMLCGCSKSSEGPTSTSSTTNEVNVPTDSETENISPTEVPNEYTIDGYCDICHKTKKLKEYRFEQKTYAVCEECYNEKILGYEEDNEVYESLTAAIYTSLTDSENASIYFDGSITLSFDNLGIHCNNDKIAKYLKEKMRIDFNKKAKAGTYKITVENGSPNTQNKPKHPLAE